VSMRMAMMMKMIRIIGITTESEDAHQFVYLLHL
jgi:hypothetical protein